MTEHRDRPARRWIVQGPAVASGVVVAHLRGDPDARLVQHRADDLVIVTMSAARAARLRVEFEELIVESDEPLDLYRP